MSGALRLAAHCLGEVSRICRDARVTRFYGGTNEIMMEIVGRSLGF